MDSSFRDRLWVSLTLLCLTASFSFFLTLRLLGWGTALLAIAVGFIIAIVLFILTTPRD